MKAPDFLRKAAQHIDDRAAARDKPEGERSMGRCVSAFNAVTGHTLTERDGWLFMVTLKMARTCNTPAGQADDYEDLAAYAALAGEAAAALPQPPPIAVLWRPWDPLLSDAKAGPERRSEVSRALMGDGQTITARDITNWGDTGYHRANIVGYKLRGDE